MPYVEGIYGYRYFEQVVVDRNKFGTSSDWGIHAAGSAFDGIVNYAIAAVNGGGYKKMPTGGGTNRFEQFDYEGRINAVYEGFNAALGGSKALGPGVLQQQWRMSGLVPRTAVVDQGGKITYAEAAE